MFLEFPHTLLLDLFRRHRPKEWDWERWVFKCLRGNGGLDVVKTGNTETMFTLRGTVTETLLNFPFFS